jgi:hypothetical protein
VKRTPLEQYGTPCARAGSTRSTCATGDRLLDVHVSDGTGDLLLASAKGG